MQKALDREKIRTVYDRVARRYDSQHKLFTANSDERGRKMVVDKTVSVGDRVLDCGAGTGCSALLAAQKTGPEGKVVLFDVSAEMLTVAKQKAVATGVEKRLDFQTGDMLELPFEDNSFDTVISTYSLCPLYDPVKGALELYRVVKRRGHIGIAHSVTPEGRLLQFLAEKVEDLVWRLPSISLGCRSVSVLPALQQVGARVILKKRIGVPLWPFLVFVVEKPGG